jgi:uncharacterized protein YutE (UPF0331/DUF86 family)
MTPVPIEKSTVTVRLNGIQSELAEIGKLAKLPKAKFIQGYAHKLASYHLHRILEGVFNISSHILSRLPGGAVTTYKDMALALGSHGIVSKKFAEGPLFHMAGYRNRLVHFYSEVTPEELYSVIKNHLKDVDTFCKAIKLVLSSPKKFGLSIE